MDWRYPKNRFFKTFRESHLSISLFLTSLLVLNLVYIIRYNVQPYHFVYAFILPILIFITFIQLHKFLVITKIYFRNKSQTYLLIKKIVHLFIIIFIIIYVAGGILYLSLSAKHNYVYYYFDDSDVELLSFIKTNTSEDSVFFADTTYVNAIIQVNTNRKTLVGNKAFTRATTSETHSRLLFGYEKLGFSTQKLIYDINDSSGYYTIFLKKVNELNLEDPQENWNDVFSYYHNIYHNGTAHDPEKLIKDISNAKLQEFKLDYVIYSEDLDKLKDTSNIMFNNKKYIIKKINN